MGEMTIDLPKKIKHTKMKDLKNFIAESIFDANLISKDLVGVIYKWFKEHVAFPKPGEPDEFIEVKNDGVYYIDKYIKGTAIDFDEVPPSFIKFDEKSWEGKYIATSYEIKSQKDFDWLPTQVMNILSRSCPDITLDTNHLQIQIQNPKSITLDPHELIKGEIYDCYITFPRVPWITEDYLLKIRSNTKNTLMDISSPRLGVQLLKQLKSKKDIYKLYKDFFDGLYKNNIKYLQVGSKDIIKISKGKVTPTRL